MEQRNLDDNISVYILLLNALSTLLRPTIQRRRCLWKHCVCVYWVVFDSLWPHGLQPTRLLCQWDFPGKITGVGCHFLFQGIEPVSLGSPTPAGRLLLLLTDNASGYPRAPVAMFRISVFMLANTMCILWSIESLLERIHLSRCHEEHCWFAGRGENMNTNRSLGEVHSYPHGSHWGVQDFTGGRIADIVKIPRELEVEPEDMPELL